MHTERLGVLVLPCAALAIACTRSVPNSCPGTGAPDDLVRRAALLRLDVYPAAVPCTGSTVDPSQGAPLRTRTYTGASFTLELPSGPSTLAVSAFLDEAGTILLGTSCTQVQVVRGTATCLELHLEPSQDIPCSAPGDCPGAYLCCGGRCANPAADARHCGGCGMECAAGEGCCGGQCRGLQELDRCGACDRVCSEANALTRSCSGGLCTSSCEPGWGNCGRPSAPAPDDGCETDLSVSVDACGSCGYACASTQATGLACREGRCEPSCASGWGDCVHPLPPEPDDGCESDLSSPAHCGSCAPCALPRVAKHLCVGGSCDIESCAFGFRDCDDAAPNGCECAGGCCGTQCETTHSTGLGPTFRDCVALGSYDRNQGIKAGQAWSAFGTTVDPAVCAAGTSAVCRLSSSGRWCACWVYADANGSGNVGRVRLTERTSYYTDAVCTCPDASSFPSWD